MTFSVKIKTIPVGNIDIKILKNVRKLKLLKISYPLLLFICLRDVYLQATD